MTPFEAYEVYMHLKLHFTTKAYDVRKYKIKRMSLTSFNKSNIKFKLQKLVRKYTNVQLREYFIANFVHGDKYGGIYSTDADDILLAWQKKIQGLSYHFKQEMLSLTEKDHFKLEDLWNDDDHPLLFREYLGKRISLETLMILDRIYGFRKIVDERLGDDFMWKPLSGLMDKYEPFLTINKEDFERIVQDIIS